MWHPRLFAIALSVLAGMALTVPRALAQGQPEELSLERAIDLALASNRPARIAALAEAKAGDDIEALRTQRLPKFDLKVLEGGFLSPLEFSFQQGSLGTYPATGPIPFSDVTVDSPRRLATGLVFGAVQPLTQLRRIAQGEKLLALGQDVAAEKTRSERQKLVADVKRAYYGLQQAKAGLVAVGQAGSQLEELERVVRSYVEAQVALPGDDLAVRTEQSRVALQRLTLRNLEATLTERINLLLGRDLTTAFAVPELPAASSVPDLAGAIAQAKASRPEIRTAGLDARRAAEDRRLKQMERTPDVSLAFSYLRTFNVDVLPHNVAAAGVILSWEPFDWGRRGAEGEARTRTLEQATLGVQETEALIELDVRVKHRTLVEARQRLELRSLERETATERLRVATDRYRVEASLLRDVLEAQTGLATAVQDYQQALGEFWTAFAEFDQSIGDDGP